MQLYAIFSYSSHIFHFCFSVDYAMHALAHTIAYGFFFLDEIHENVIFITYVKIVRIL